MLKKTLSQMKLIEWARYPQNTTTKMYDRKIFICGEFEPWKKEPRTAECLSFDCFKAKLVYCLNAFVGIVKMSKSRLYRMMCRYQKWNKWINSNMYNNTIKWKLIQLINFSLLANNSMTVFFILVWPSHVTSHLWLRSVVWGIRW